MPGPARRDRPLRVQMAECCARGLDDGGRDLLADVLETFEVNNWALGTSLVEALAACGRITPIDAEGTIAARIGALLTRPDDPAAWKEAATVVTNQFENEDIVGPYTATVDSLEQARKARLYVMAVRGQQVIWRGWTLRELATLTPCGDRNVDADIAAVLADAARRPPEPGPALQESVATHLAGVRGWAALSDVLPPAPAIGDADARAWRLFDQLLLHAERAAGGLTSAGDPAAWWSELHHGLPQAAPDVLCWLARSEWGEGTRYVTCHQLLVDTWPDEIRRLLEWGLVHRESLTSLLPAAWRPDERARYIVETLGTVGDHGTAALLRGYLPDPDLGPATVAALRRLDTDAA